MPRFVKFVVIGVGAVLALMIIIAALGKPPPKVADKGDVDSLSTAGPVRGDKAPTERKAALEKPKASAPVAMSEDQRKGFHCLSSWDGSHRELVSAVKETLREPDSFEHAETKILPVDKEGQHLLSMKYRARNGFGGMNLNTLYARVQNSDCSFEILITDP